MVDLLRFLRDRRVVAQRGGRWELVEPVAEIKDEIPKSVRSMVQKKIDQLAADDRRLLTAASVQGHEFEAVVAFAIMRGWACATTRKKTSVFPASHSPIRGRPTTDSAVSCCDSLEPATIEAQFLVNRMRNLGVLIGTDGPLHNFIKIRPPMTFGITEAKLLIEAVDRCFQMMPPTTE